jgi:hypothetical protein
MILTSVSGMLASAMKAQSRIRTTLVTSRPILSGLWKPSGKSRRADSNR